jgi:shikimate kinase
MPRPIVLIGLSGAGKSTVARLAASLLDTTWIDLDLEIEAAAGCTVEEVFARGGEAAFRERERAAMAAALAGPPAVIASGAGWAAQPGNLAGATPAAFTLYLSLAPEAAARRLGAAGDRPLLAGDPLPKLREQLGLRERLYRLAELEIDASGPPALVAEAVAVAARHYAGW